MEDKIIEKMEAYYLENLRDNREKQKIFEDVFYLINKQKEKIRVLDIMTNYMADELKKWDINDKHYNNASNAKEVKKYFYDVVTYL